MKIKAPSAVKPAPATAGGGAIMADRFKLDMPPPAKPSGGGPFAMVAVVAAVLALMALGGMVFFLNSSWGQMQLL